MSSSFPAWEAQQSPAQELELYVSGLTPRSVRALEVVKRLCRERLAGRCKLTVVDVYQQPDRVRENNVIAVPTLIRLRPAPVRRVIGDLSDESKVLALLGLHAAVT